MLMHFHLDLLDFYRGKISIRRIHVLIWRLLKMYGQSALAEALLGEQASWSNTNYILADLADRLEAANYIFIEAHKAENASNPTPTPYPRPGMKYDSETSHELIQGDRHEWATAQDLNGFLTMLGG